MRSYTHEDVMELVRYTKTCIGHNWNQEAKDYAASILAPFAPDPAAEPIEIAYDISLTPALGHGTLGSHKENAID